MSACVPKTNRKAPIPHDDALYHSRHKIEIMLGCLLGLAYEPYLAATDAPTSSCPPSPQPSSSGFISEPRG